ncbi:C3 and PZP-like alpha-2-macroglobulin domain-containing protein 8 [Mizuhopecten yessoensis]|uniref:C3 and PZP-like alpha-2-macroglobulin domain-containing protein 8 n=1 Tax=Mizuhopecten yessoensis TaxID=6573 RepID=A0A210QHM9_MIZYE|nr:C3 and PZP-like alpha-2-macroglobulin domain-containing protein 8 [Mizuhopecten yessoensis]
MLLSVSPSESSFQFSTRNDYHYHYLHDSGLDVTGHTSFTFQVKACHDAHIALSQDKGVDTKNTYEIVIGGWGDQQSVIRDCKQCAQMDVENHMPHPLSCTQYRPFWISWANNIIRVGQGDIVGKSQFMMWNDTSPHDVNYVAVATGFGSSGDWQITVGNYWPGQFWLGLSDLAVEGEWMWLPQQGSLTYTNWGPNEPDNAQNREHCALVDLHRNYTWSDDNCEELRFTSDEAVNIGRIIFNV